MAAGSERQIALVVLGIVAIVGILGLVMLLSSKGITGKSITGLQVGEEQRSQFEQLAADFGFEDRVNALVDQGASREDALATVMADFHSYVESQTGMSFEDIMQTSGDHEMDIEVGGGLFEAGHEMTFTTDPNTGEVTVSFTDSTTGETFTMSESDMEAMSDMSTGDHSGDYGSYSEAMAGHAAPDAGAGHTEAWSGGGSESAFSSGGDTSSSSSSSDSSSSDTSSAMDTSSWTTSTSSDGSTTATNTATGETHTMSSGGMGGGSGGGSHSA